MTNKEMSVEFDVLYNNITSNLAPGLNEYEKSIFLTRAQEETVMTMYNGNFGGQSLDSSEDLREYLGGLVKSATQDFPSSPSTPLEKEPGKSYYRQTMMKQNSWDEEVWFIATETVKCAEGCLKGTSIPVVPVSSDNLNRLLENPFKGPSDRRVLRRSTTVHAFYTLYPLSSWTYDYLSRPEPIVLEDCPSGYSIEGVSEETPCKLPESVHRMILNRATQVAKASWMAS